MEIGLGSCKTIEAVQIPSRVVVLYFVVLRVQTLRLQQSEFTSDDLICPRDKDHYADISNFPFLYAPQAADVVDVHLDQRS